MNLPEQTVFVLGAGGMLGQAMARQFNVYAPILLPRRDLDITDQHEMHRIFRHYRPGLIINCAAYTAVDQCETDEAAAELVNGTAVGLLAREAAAIGATLVHFSTDYVFDGQDHHRHDEQSDLAPLSAYGRTKAAGEYELRRSTGRVFLIRTAWLYGPGGRNFIDTIIERGRTATEVRVVNDQHGAPTFSRDLARFTHDLVADNDAEPGIYHGVNDGQATWYDVAIEAFIQANVPTPIWACTTAEFPRPAKRPQYSIRNTKRPPLRDWRQALADYLQ